QNDPSWRDFIMQAGGDPIGGFGCALTSTTMLLNYYGSSMSPADLNACLGPGADPIVWTQAPLCTAGRVQGGERSDFSWDAVDGLLRAGKPAIVGMLRGLTGMHFVVVTQGGGGEADNYHITDPWDGTVSKTLGSYTNTGYNPRWLVSYDGSGRNCARLLPPSPPLVRGFQDGATYRGGVSVSVPSGAPGATVQPASGQGSSGQPGGPASGTRTRPPSGSASGSRGQSPGPGAGGPGGIRVEPGHQILIDQEGVYLVYVRHPGSAYPPRFSILKFAIDRTPPTLSLVGLD